MQGLLDEAGVLTTTELVTIVRLTDDQIAPPQSGWGLGQAHVLSYVSVIMVSSLGRWHCHLEAPADQAFNVKVSQTLCVAQSCRGLISRILVWHAMSNINAGVSQWRSTGISSFVRSGPCMCS